jgi:hypothetical protein
MAEFNWDDHPIVEPTADSSKKEFSWEDHPVVENTEPLEVTPEVSKTESAIRGATQGASLGFGDELAGLVSGAGKAAGLEDLGGPLKDVSISKEGPTLDFSKLVKAYQKTRDTERAKNKLAEEANPKTYLATNIAGSLAPTIASGALGQGISGAGRIAGLAGLGTSSEDLTKNDKSMSQKLGNVTEDVAYPAMLGSAIGAIPVIGSKFVNKTVPGKVLTQELAGNKIVGEEARKQLGNELVENAGNIGSKIQNELTGAAEAKGAELKNLAESGKTYDITDLAKQLPEDVKNLPTSFLPEQDTARKAILEPMERAQKLGTIATEATPTSDIMNESVKLSPKEIDSLRAAFGKLGYIKDLKDSDVVSLAKQFSGKLASKLNNDVNPQTGEIVQSKLGGLNNKIQNLIEAQDIFNTSGKGLDELGNQKTLTPLLQRLESDTTSSDIARSQFKKGIEALKQANPKLGSEIEQSAEDIAGRYDLARDVNKPITISREGGKRAAMVGAGYLGRGLNSLDESLGGLGTDVIKPITKALIPSFEKGGANVTLNTAKDTRAADTSTLDRKFSEMGPEQLKAVADRLRARGGNEGVVKKVEQAAESNNPTQKAQAEFVIKQNPNARKALEFPNESNNII